MKLHGNARTCLHSRLLIVEWVLEQRCAVAAAAEAAGVNERTAAKWLARYRREGRDGRADRSSAPRRIPRRTIAERVRVTRYECSRPGELVHVDVKKLGRFTRPGHRVLERGSGRFEEGAAYE
jgi:hypothetical protein